MKTQTAAQLRAASEPRGRPSVREASPVAHRNEVRERLLHAALELVNNEGIQNFTQARVAAAAGVRQSHLTYYFPTRNDLLKALMQEGTARFRHLLDAELPRGPRALPRLREAFAERPIDRAMPRLMIALTVASEEDASLKHWLEEMSHGVHARLRELFARFGVDAADGDVALFHVSLIGIAMLHLGSDAPRSAARSRELVCHAFDRLVASVRGTTVAVRRRASP